MARMNKCKPALWFSPHCPTEDQLKDIMIVSDRANAKGQPLVIHNIGSGTMEEDRLFEFKITGHYRIGKLAPARTNAGHRDNHSQSASLAIESRPPGVTSQRDQQNQSAK